MKIVYLDQFAVSDLADSKQEIWIDIKIKLIELSKKKKLACPLSIEHYLESSARSDQEAVANDIFLNTVSNDLCIRLEFDMTVELIKRLVRNETRSQEIFLGEAIKNKFFDASKINLYREFQKKIKDVFDNQNSLSNEIREIVRSKRISNPLESNIFKSAKMIRPLSFIERMDEVFALGKLIIRGEETPHGEIPNWIDIILEYLLRYYKFSADEIIWFRKEIQENGFDNIPTLDIICRLEAYQAILYKKISSNDIIDNLRLATGLPISNVLLTDKKRKSELVDLGLDKKYNCLVLSGESKDLTTFSKYLKELS